MKISKQARRDARQLFRTCFVDQVLNEDRTRRAVQLVIQDKPRGYTAVLSQFQRLLKLEIARRTALIESAAPLTPQFQTEVQANLTAKYGAGLNFTFVQNPALLAGMRIKVGGDVYDGTVQGRLAALQNSL